MLNAIVRYLHAGPRHWAYWWARSFVRRCDDRHAMRQFNPIHVHRAFTDDVKPLFGVRP